MVEMMAVKRQKGNPLIYLFGKTWEYSRGNKKSVVLYWAMFIVANAGALIAHPLILAKMFSTLQAEGVTGGNFWFLIKLLLANFSLTFMFWGLHGPARCIERANAYRVRAGYCKYLVKGILTLPLDWHSEHHSGDTIDKIDKGRQGIYAFASDSFEPIYAGVRLIVSVFMLSYFSHKADVHATGLIVLTMIALTAFIVIKFDKKIMANYKLLNRGDNLVSASIIDAISHITTVISLRVEKRQLEFISHNVDAPFQLYKATNRINETKWFLVSVCCSIMWMLVLGNYFWDHIDAVKGVLIGSIFLLIRYLDEMSNLFQRFADMYSEVLQRQARVLNAEEIATEFKEESLTNHVLPKNWQTIEVKNLNFTYKNSEGKTLHLSDINLSIKRGLDIALVGWSGGGKSTYLKTMRDLHQPESGNVSVDGLHIPEGFAGIKNDISLIQQQPEIFATTIRNNITIGAECSLEKIRYYMDMACFSEVLDSLPKGLDSVINERGVNLSGGQRQRLALTRGLLASEGKSLILIDEPTSSVDEATKYRIFNNIRQGFKESCIIFATHEIQFLPLFDYVYMFENGRITGSGTVESLTESCPEFRKLCAHSKQERAS
ncbi:MAG: ABC transporter ATP-binding protein [bacterium]|nr:ABC transporter ATP-binding protein [bacterium]